MNGCWLPINGEVGKPIFTAQRLQSLNATMNIDILFENHYNFSETQNVFKCEHLHAELCISFKVKHDHHIAWLQVTGHPTLKYMSVSPNFTHL